MTSSNRQNKFDSRMRQAREGPKQPKNAAKIQEAIQQQYRLVPAANEKTDDTKSNLTKFDEKKISPSAKDKSKSDNTVTTGTLKFMVSHSKSSKLRNAEPTQSTKQKRDASGGCFETVYKSLCAARTVARQVVSCGPQMKFSFRKILFENIA